MSGWEWVVVVWLAVSGIAVLVRGIVGSTRTYTELDGLLAVAECAFLIWIVVTQL